MSIETQILGRPGEDNATLFWVDSGNSIARLLFDCGENCLRGLANSDIQAIDHLFFSHFHMDHICGFDGFFRHNYNRPGRPVTVWGPPGTIDIMYHRMRGFTWNLHHRQPGKWVVNELHKNGYLKTSVFLTRNAFRKSTIKTTRPEPKNQILIDQNYIVSTRFLNHGSTPSLAYRIDEPMRENIDPAKLKDIGIKPGPWIRDLKDNSDWPADHPLELEGKTYTAGDLRSRLLVETPGDSAAYLTDFIIEPGSKDWKAAVKWLTGVGTLVCEAQYRESDHEMARANSHMTAKRVAQLARDCQAKRLIIQHVSRRYDYSGWKDMLAEAKAVFPNTIFPEDWKI